MSPFGPFRVIRSSVIIATLVVFGGAAAAHAQVFIGGGPVPRRGSWEISGGGLWSQGYDLGDTPATLTRNPGTGSGPFELFASETRVEPAPAGHGRLAIYLAPRVSIEGGVQYSRPRLSTSLSSDAEGAAPITVSETVTRYVFTGSVVFHFNSFGNGRGVPFVFGGGGYVRELHEGAELVETGQEIHLGAGIKYWFGARRRRAGLRGDVGLSLRDRGIDFSEQRRTLPTAGVSFVYLF